MKKLMALLLALIMAFSLVTPAFADAGDPKPVKMNVRVADGSHYALPVDYIFSLENATRVANATIVFEVDGAMLEGGDLAFLTAGFSAMNPGDGAVTWSQKDNGIWQGELLVMYLGGLDGFTAVPETDIFKLSYRAKQLGDATLRVTEIRIVGFDDAGEPVFLADGPGGEARTVIARPDALYSVYDLNRDGVIDERDLAMAQRYYMVKTGDASWDAAQRCDFNTDGQVDMLDLIDLFQNFGIAVPPDIAPGAITVSSLSAMELAAGRDGTVSVTAAASNGQAVSLAAWSDDTDVATVSLSGGTLTVTAVAPGAAAVSVIASAPNCLNVVRTFTVTVTEFTPGDEPGLVKLAENHPNVTLLDQKEKALTVTSGTKVSDLLAQVEFTDGVGSMKVVDWMDGEKNTPNLDMLVTGDRLVATQGEEEAEYTVEVPGEAPYWNGDTYNSILTTVKENLPTFKDDVFDITDGKYAELIRQVTFSGKNAAGATVTNTNVNDYTVVFRKAIADCAANGGGIVLVPASATPYFTGAIWLENNVNLHVETGALIEFIAINATGAGITAEDLYPRTIVSYESTDYYGYSAPIHANGKTGFAVTGGGTVAYSAADGLNFGGDIENTVRQWNYGQTPLELRDAFALKQKFATPLIQLYDCKNFIISDITLGNSAFWSTDLILCENALVRGIKPTSKTSNSDGVNPNSSKNIIIENCVFANKDDNIAIKSGRGYNGLLRGTPTSNIIIRGNKFSEGTGLSVGSEVGGGANGIFIENNFWGSGTASIGNVFRIKIANSLGEAVLENIYYRNIAVGNVAEAFVSIEYTLDHTQTYATGERYGTLNTVPTIRNIGMSNLFTVNGNSKFNQFFIKAEIQDLRPVQNFYLKDIDLTTAGITGTQNYKYLMVNNVDLHMDNVKVNDKVYHSEKTVRVTDVKANGIALGAGTAEITSTGTNGTVVVTGIVETDIENFETVGSVRVSFDQDYRPIAESSFPGLTSVPLPFVNAVLEKVDDKVQFTATLTGVGASIHDIAVVAKSNKLPYAVAQAAANGTVDQNGGSNQQARGTADMVYVSSNAYRVDVEGTLRAMKVTYEYTPNLTPYLNVPVFLIGNTVTVKVNIVDAKTGIPVEGATIQVVRGGTLTVSTPAYSEEDGYTFLLGATGTGNVRNHVLMRVTCPGYTEINHSFRRILAVANRTELAKLFTQEAINLYFPLPPG